jgi:phosphatidylglycerol:prolipoprotein diacylglycerol transferase
VEWPVSRQQCGSAEYNGIWDFAKQVCRPKESDCWAWAKFYSGGLAYYGGFGAASAAAWYLLRTDRFPFWKAADMAGMVIPVGLGFGRIGCNLAGCCFGTPWDSSWAVAFPGGSPASDAQHKLKLLESAGRESLPVHPTQLYESIASFAIAGFLILWLHGKKRYDGQVFIAFVVLYGVARFLIEFVRAEPRGAFLGLSTSQLLSLVLFGAAYYFHKKRSEKVAAALAPAPSGSVPA